MVESTGDQDPWIDRTRAEALAATLRVVADPTRLQILSMIERSPDGRATVGQLTEWMGFRQPTMSHHLKLLHDAGLLAREKAGRQVWYAITPSQRSAVADLLR